jgi:hypothetical protein
VACRPPEQLLLPLDDAPPRAQRAAEVGVPLRGPGRLDFDEGQRLTGLARALLRRGAAVEAVHDATGIRPNTLHMMLTRLRRKG